MLKKMFARYKMLMSVAAVALLGMLSGCNHFAESTEKDSTKDIFGRPIQNGDPLPGDIVAKTMEQDSIFKALKDVVYSGMAGVLKNYGSKFREEYNSKYFITDLDNDGLPELWVKIGNYGDSGKLELYYPQSNGNLKKSFLFASPGKYYLGDSYLMQVVPNGPGYIEVNKIFLHRDEIHVDHIMSLDLYNNPDAKVPDFKEPEIQDISFKNLKPLQDFFHTSEKAPAD